MGMKKVLSLLAVAMLATACSSDASGDVNGSWQLTAGSVDGADIPILDTHPITITFDGENVNGTASCNGYGGTVEINGSSISFGSLAMTEMACQPPETMEAEAMFGEALSRVDTIEVGDDLVLTGSGVELTFEALEPIAESELTDTIWVLESLRSGDAVSSVGGQPATLELKSDGSVTGDTGCRAFSGSYVIEGPQVVLIELAADGHQCEPDLADQDGHVLTVLGDGFRVEIDGNTLNLWSTGDEGLIYKAQA